MHFLEFSLHFKLFFKPVLLHQNLNLCTKSVKVLEKCKCRQSNFFFLVRGAFLQPFSNEKHVHAEEIVKLPLLQLGGKCVNTQEIVKFPLLQLGAKRVNVQEIAKFLLLQVGEKDVNTQEIVKFPLLHLGEKPVNAQDIAEFPLLQLGE
jgi:hypothetical protein